MAYHRTSAVGQSKAAKERHRTYRLAMKNMGFLPLIIACGAIISAIMVFGNPLLWISEDQRYSQGFAEGIDKEDYLFLTDIADGIEGAGTFVVWGEYRSISLDDTVGRVVNVGLAAKALDGYEIKPGDTLSFNEIAGNVEQDNEYQLATDYDGYEAKRVRGGGISQVASALYIAALKADLEIIERHAYAVVQDYAPLGFDAAIAYGSKDLKIKNTSDVPLYIRATASGQTAEVKLYGKQRDGDANIEILPETIEAYESPLTDVLENPDALGQAEFFTVEAYRVYYQSSEEMNRELLSTDTYLVSPAFIEQ